MAAALSGLPFAARPADAKSVKIRGIESGRVGGTIGGLWVKAGYEVMSSARELRKVLGIAS